MYTYLHTHASRTQRVHNTSPSAHAFAPHAISNCITRKQRNTQMQKRESPSSLTISEALVLTSQSRSEKTTSGPEWRPNRELGFLFAVPILPIITADVLSNQSTPRQLRISNHEGSWVFFPKKDLDLRNIWGMNLPTTSSHQARR